MREHILQLPWHILILARYKYLYFIFRTHVYFQVVVTEFERGRESSRSQEIDTR